VFWEFVFDISGPQNQVYELCACAVLPGILGQHLITKVVS